MSIDLEWSALDAELTRACTRFLSDAFTHAPTPDFLGPLEVTAFSFGDAHPDLTLVDIRDIQHEFLQPQHGDGGSDDDDDQADFPLPSPPPLERNPPTWHSHTFPSSPPASVSGRSGFGPLGGGPALFSPGLLHHQHPGGVGLSALAGTPLGSAGPGASLHGARPGAGSRSRSRSPAAAAAAAAAHGRPPLAGGGAHPLAQHDLHSQHTHTHPHSYAAPSPSPSLSSLPPLPAPSSAPSPSFQVHLRLSYSGNLSLGIATALRINYPSSSFMSLPLSLTLTGLALEGTLVVAFEGGRRRVHLSLLEPDPASLADDPPNPGDSPTKPFARLPGSGSGPGAGSRSTPGARVLRAAHVESEVGQADKHVLRNVGKVEKFVVDVARKTLENELVFPNFQTIVF
ncbi:hypothetical protein JCM9279_002041 [Rhodotorula babjevae]